MDWFEKVSENPYKDLYWNVPEVKQGKMNVVGGNAGRFHAPVTIANLVKNRYPVKEVVTVLPEKLAPLFRDFPEMLFVEATEAGTFADGEKLGQIFSEADFNLLVGDLSKNAVTTKAMLEAVAAGQEKPILITRDAVDVFAEGCTEASLMNENLIIFSSMVQLQKILRAVYYPKVLLLTQPLLQVAEVLHKFTLSYPVTVITLQMGQILVARDGRVMAVPFEKAGVPITLLWNGELAARIAVLNLFNPQKMLEASVAGIFGES